VSRLMQASRVACAKGFQPVATAAVLLAWWVAPTRTDHPLETAAILLLVANLGVYVLELVVVGIPAWKVSRRDAAVDFFYVMTRTLIIGPVFQILVLVTIEPWLQGLLPIWPHHWPLLAKIVLALVLGDAIGFGVHRAMHTIPALWRFHATHHAQAKLNSARWSANHPGEYFLLNLPIFAVIAVLGPDFAEIAGAIVIGRMTVVIAHSSLPLTTSLFSVVFTSPSHHRRHHALGQPTTVNYGDALIVLDRLVGSFTSDTTTKVGAGSGPDLNLADQLLLPWRLYKLDGPVVDLRDSQAPTRRRPAPNTRRNR